MCGADLIRHADLFRTVGNNGIYQRGNAGGFGIPQHIGDCRGNFVLAQNARSNGIINIVINIRHNIRRADNLSLAGFGNHIGVC